MRPFDSKAHCLFGSWCCFNDMYIRIPAFNAARCNQAFKFIKNQPKFGLAASRKIFREAREIIAIEVYL
ncbi:MAG: hypothetical protein A3G24_26475 [Betaproteobacteria bacterium RIFCSPLOWO2_12_FULL_62_13]|nr:MAG: hypothetical protein A3G24_26475 [Betaproteobacteria bacterium RIFCSPLOWO2_12_FULL_62_13]